MSANISKKCSRSDEIARYLWESQTYMSYWTPMSTIQLSWQKIGWVTNEQGQVMNTTRIYWRVRKTLISAAKDRSKENSEMKCSHKKAGSLETCLLKSQKETSLERRRLITRMHETESTKTYGPVLVKTGCQRDLCYCFWYYGAQGKLRRNKLLSWMDQYDDANTIHIYTYTNIHKKKPVMKNFLYWS